MEQGTVTDLLGDQLGASKLGSVLLHEGLLVLKGGISKRSRCD